MSKTCLWMASSIIIFRYYSFTDHFECFETLNFDGGFTFAVALSTLPQTKGLTCVLFCFTSIYVLRFIKSLIFKILP